MRRGACVRASACAARSPLARATISLVPRRAYSERQHAELIRDQFTKQAEKFSMAAPLNDKETLDSIIKFAEAKSEDEMIDFACGPGIIACAFAPHVKRVVGLDLTPEMLKKANALKKQRGLTNVEFIEGSALKPPISPASFSLMKRACKKGGRVVVIDTIPKLEHAKLFNRFELLRDPSHVRAMPKEEITELFGSAGLPRPRIMMYRMQSDLDSLMARSFPTSKEDEKEARRLMTDSIATDVIGLQPRKGEDGRVYYSLPVGMFVANV